MVQNDLAEGAALLLEAAHDRVHRLVFAEVAALDFQDLLVEVEQLVFSPLEGLAHSAYIIPFFQNNQVAVRCRHDGRIPRGRGLQRLLSEEVSRVQLDHLFAEVDLKNAVDSGRQLHGEVVEVDVGHPVESLFEQSGSHFGIWGLSLDYAWGGTRRRLRGGSRSRA